MRLPTTNVRWATLAAGVAAAVAAFFVVGGVPGVLYAAAAVLFALLVYARLPEERAASATESDESAAESRSGHGRVQALEAELVQAQRTLSELQARLTELEHEREAHVMTMEILEAELTTTRALAAERVSSPAAEDLDRLVSALAVQDRQLTALEARVRAVDRARTGGIDAAEPSSADAG